MSVIFGVKLSEYWAKRDPGGLWVRTSQDCFPLSVDVSLDEYSMTWPAWGIESAGVVGQLPKSARSTGARGFLLLPTITANDAKNSLTESQRGRGTLTAAMLPTPQAFDANNCPAGNLEARKKKGGCRNLAQEISMLATPAAFQMHNPVRPLAPSEKDGSHGQMLVGQIGEELNGSEPETGERGTLNASFVERMMGFPDGWTLPD